MKECSAFPRIRQHWTQEGRESLQRLWNANVARGHSARSMRAFAAAYRLSHGRLQRELRSGFTETLLRDKARGGWHYPEYSAWKAQRAADAQKANKGRRSTVTNHFADRLVAFLKDGFSVGTCLHHLRREGWQSLPSQRAVYYHLKDGVIVLPQGRLRYRPRPKRKHKPPRKGNVLPDRRSIDERPDIVERRDRIGDWEMDCVVSGRAGKGGLLVLLERRTRYVLLRPLRAITQRAVHRALRELMKENALPVLHTLTTDNGGEFLAPRTLERILRVPVYYTHVYASWEKGSVEHANGLLRHWHPKGTDFSRLTPADIHTLQTHLNAIARPITLKGLAAHEAFSALS